MKNINIKKFKDNIIANKVYDIILNTNESLFLTGKAGTGKSTLVKCIISNTTKKHVVLAPTSVAAKNIDGQTIHSVFKIPPYAIRENFSFIKELSYSQPDLIFLKEIELIIIDEISMVTSAMLDLLDKILKKMRNSFKPFGGVQMLLIGDPLQLSPVVTIKEREIISKSWDSEYFFDARSYKNVIKHSFQLEICYRQKEQKHLKFLDAIRTNSITQNELDELNKICLENLNKSNEDKIIITTHNKIATSENENKLRKLNSKLREYISLEAGEINRDEYNAEIVLRLKVGAKVIFIKNNREAGYINGTIGYVEKLNDDSIDVKTEDGKAITVIREEWINFKNKFNPVTKKIEKEAIGLFSQFPLKLGWALTVNKSQGLTFDNIHLDFRYGAFCPFQTYVAFSRGKTLNKISISKPFEKRDITTEPKLMNFYNSNFA